MTTCPTSQLFVWDIWIFLNKWRTTGWLQWTCWADARHRQTTRSGAKAPADSSGRIACLGGRMAHQGASHRHLGSCDGLGSTNQMCSTALASPLYNDCSIHVYPLQSSATSPASIVQIGAVVTDRHWARVVCSFCMFQAVFPSLPRWEISSVLTVLYFGMCHSHDELPTRWSSDPVSQDHHNLSGPGVWVVWLPKVILLSPDAPTTSKHILGAHRWWSQRQMKFMVYLKSLLEIVTIDSSHMLCFLLTCTWH